MRTLKPEGQPEGSKKLDLEAIEDPELITAVESRWDKLNELTGRKKDENPAVSDDDEDEPTPDDEDIDNDDQADDSEDSDDSTPDGKDKEKETEGIPDAYLRAAVHSGWKQEDVEKLYETNPEMASKTFENLYNSTNKASREWAALGRARLAGDVKETEPEKVDKLEYGRIDVATLKRDFDIDPAVERMLESANARDQKLTDAINSLREEKVIADPKKVERAAQNYDVAAEAAAEQQINSFFSEDSMKPYGKFYGELKFGETWEDLPAGQKRNRYAVYTAADQMLAGAAMQGYQMSIPDALDKAHLLVTENVREETIRAEIKSTATKRKNSMLMRPSDGKSKKGSSDGKSKTKNELLSKTERLLAKTFGK